MRILQLLFVLVASALLAGSSCAPDSAPLLPAEVSSAPTGPVPGRTLILRLVQITDTHVVDTLSPARWAGGHNFNQSAWRPFEAYSMQILDGIVRVTNRIHASGTPIDFVLHTGDAIDNAQQNEYRWFLDIMDGREVNPLSGPDDRPEADRPPPLLDPYAAFQPQGLYRSGVHGSLPSIPWYGMIGNHETYAIGVFPIVDARDGTRVAPLPLDFRPGLLLPTVFDPVGSLAWGNVTPADPGPPRLLEPPRYVVPNPERAYIRKPEIVQALLGTETGPAGHGFASADGPTWYSLSPVSGVRLIALDTADQPHVDPGFVDSEGCISQRQADFLKSELDAAQARGELVIVATHHPSQSLEVLYGTALDPEGFRSLLNQYSNVVLHLSGHLHRNRVVQRGGYVEIETCSTLDLPQEARLVELWRDDADGSVVIAYRTFSYLDESYPPLGEDPLRPLRAQGREIATGDTNKAIRQKQFDPSGADPAGEAADRAGEIRIGR